jgi:hypothetical protein
MGPTFVSCGVLQIINKWSLEGKSVNLQEVVGNPKAAAKIVSNLLLLFRSGTF